MYNISHVGNNKLCAMTDVMVFVTVAARALIVCTQTPTNVSEFDAIMSLSHRALYCRR